MDEVRIDPAEPDRLYTAKEAARLLRLTVNRVYVIPASQLPRTKAGPKGGRTLFLGRHINEYLTGRYQSELAAG